LKIKNESKFDKTVEFSVTQDNLLLSEVKMNKVLKNCDNFKLLVIFDCADLISDKSRKMIQQLTRFVRILSERGLQIENLKEYIEPLFVGID
jgi:hypothetical protein